MIGHGLFASEPIGNFFSLHAVIFEILKYYFIIKPPACWVTDVSIEIYELLLLFSITNPWLNLIFLGVYGKRWPKCAPISKQKLI